jgi:malonyl CoA-acyl carrier protein transacylase
MCDLPCAHILLRRHGWVDEVVKKELDEPKHLFNIGLGKLLTSLTNPLMRHALA